MVDIIDIGTQGVSGVAFGGSNMDILFVTVALFKIQLTTGKILNILPTGSSLYKVTGLGVRGPKATSFILEQETETT